MSLHSFTLFKNHRLVALALLLPASMLLTQCAPLLKGTRFASSEATQSLDNPPLLESEAQVRSQQVSDLRYALWFGLGNAPEGFQGRTLIWFTWKGPADSGALSARFSESHPLFLDFEGGSIDSLRINDFSFSSTEAQQLHQQGRIRLPRERLHLGLNRIEIAYTHPYGRNGVGLHRFEDPEDHRVYLYSHSEPFDAHRFFPCFDQPDLKASFELTVEAPQDWTVISNRSEREVVNFDGRSSWAFPPTARFSTYLFALHAGPYHSWKSTYRGMPLRLFSRQSMKTYISSAEWFAVTRAGFDYFNSYFKTEYPFLKYDQIIVPEFNAGAMENVAAVTFSERLAFRSQPTAAQRRSRATTILHEMAHMWFGNLVTMKWWNGLWLNESFATFASVQALEHLAHSHPELRSASWTQALRENPGHDLFNEKKWAYRADQVSTTHPIETPVPDTDEASSHFDGITYNKGAAVLKQLAFRLGPEAFQRGLSLYFHRYAFSNTDAGQFWATLEEASGTSLKKWPGEWLESSGVNTLEVQWQCDDQKRIRSLTLLQGNTPTSAQLRTHDTQLALYDDRSRIIATLRAQYSGETTDVRSAHGLRCPAWVSPNHQDQDYVEVRLDPVTRRFLQLTSSTQSPLRQGPSLLTRDQLWYSLWRDVLDGRLSANEYATLAFRDALDETDPALLGSILRRLHSGSPEISVWTLLNPAEAQALSRRLHEKARTKLWSAKSPDLKRRWWQLALRTAEAAEDALWLQAIISGKTPVPHFVVDQERRWEGLEAWARISQPDWSAWETAFAQEKTKDRSDAGRKWALALSAARATARNKKAAIEQALSKTLSLSELRTTIGSLWWKNLEQLVPELENQYFSLLPTIFQGRTSEEASSLLGGLYPYSCGSRGLSQLQAFLGKNPQLPASALKTLKWIRDEESRCYSLRSKTTGQ
ncbi:MAG: aminopeptidase [Pseudomonadota bacterium]|jgi:aminopeptidase N